MTRSLSKAAVSIAAACALGMVTVPVLAHANDTQWTTHWVLAADETKVLKKEQTGKHPDNDGETDIASYELVEVKEDGNRVINTYRPRTYVNKIIVGKNITRWVEESTGKVLKEEQGRFPDSDGVTNPDIAGYSWVTTKTIKTKITPCTPPSDSVESGTPAQPETGNTDSKPEGEVVQPKPEEGDGAASGGDPTVPDPGTNEQPNEGGNTTEGGNSTEGGDTEPSTPNPDTTPENGETPPGNDNPAENGGTATPGAGTETGNTGEGDSNGAGDNPGNGEDNGSAEGEEDETPDGLDQDLSRPDRSDNESAPYRCYDFETINYYRVTGVEIPLPTPVLVDPCGVDNASWKLPAESETVKWEIKANSLIAYAKNGFHFPGKQFKKVFGKPVDSGLACALPAATDSKLPAVENTESGVASEPVDKGTSAVDNNAAAGDLTDSTASANAAAGGLTASKTLPNTGASSVLLVLIPVAGLLGGALLFMRKRI